MEIKQWIERERERKNMEYPAKQSNYWDRRGDIIVYGRGGIREGE